MNLLVISRFSIMEAIKLEPELLYTKKMTILCLSSTCKVKVSWRYHHQDEGYMQIFLIDFCVSQTVHAFLNVRIKN